MKITEGASATSSCLKITGVATKPLGVELQAVCDIDDLSLYYLGKPIAIPRMLLSNVRLAFIFPAGSKLQKGDFVTVANDATDFETVGAILDLTLKLTLAPILTFTPIQISALALNTYTDPNPKGLWCGSHVHVWGSARTRF